VAGGGRRLSALAGYSERRGDAYEDGSGRRFTELANYRPGNRGDRAFSVGTAWGRVVWAPADSHQVDVSYTRQDSGAVLYPYLLMDALWDDTDRLNLRYEATGLGARRASVRAQGYFTQVDHWMTDEKRTSSIGRPRAYSMGTRAETRTVGGKAEAVLGGLSVGAEGYERYWDATNEMAGSSYAPQAMIPGVTVRTGGVFAEYVRVLGRGLALSAGGRLDLARSEADGARANTALYEAYQANAALSAEDTLPAGRRASPGTGGPGTSRWAWGTPPARPRPPSATSPCAAWAATGSATPASSRAGTRRSTPRPRSRRPASGSRPRCTAAAWPTTSPSTTSPAGWWCPAS
jgi:iron complex outermembrane recepter protein